MSMVQKWLSCLFLAVLGTALMLPVSAHAAPSISEVLPDHASMQSFITLYGSDFGDAQGTSYVTLGGRMLPVIVWTPNALHVVVNPLAYNKAPVALNTVYPIQVVTGTGSSKSNTVNFTLTAGASPVVTTPVASDQPSDQPTFECVNKTLFCPGDILTIFGSGFGLAQGIGYVTITVPSGTSTGIPVLSWSENAISTSLNLPAGAQPGHYEVTVHRGDNGKTVSGPFTVGLLMNGSCVSGSPQVHVSTNFLNFGSQTIGGTAGPLCFTITNMGTGPLDLSSPSITNCSAAASPSITNCSAAAGFAIVSGGSPVTLAPGASHDVCITFSPQQPATFDSHVVITTNAAGGPIDVQVHGIGTPIPGVPQVGITFVGAFRGSFGDLNVGGTTGPQCFTITNTGTGPLNINGISIIHCSDSVDPHSIDCSAVAGFAIVSGGIAGGSPVTLAPGASQTVCITFTPMKAATFSGFVSISSNAPDSPRSVELHGSGDP